VIWTHDKDETVYLCGCKRSGKRPYCDGTHNKL
jgi:CDGSH iron-sulfur domain-containing protein 3